MARSISSDLTGHCHQTDWGSNDECRASEVRHCRRSNRGSRLTVRIPSGSTYGAQPRASSSHGAAHSHVCDTLTDLSFPQIAKAFGGRDHTTVIHAVDKISALLAGDDERTYRDVGALLGAFESEEP
jgi:hypothetical protein